MKASELKELSLSVTSEEYNEVIALLKQAAEEGGLSCEFSSLKDSTIEKLKADGYKVDRTFSRVSNWHNVTNQSVYLVSFG